MLLPPQPHIGQDRTVITVTKPTTKTKPGFLNMSFYILDSPCLGEKNIIFQVNMLMQVLFKVPEFMQADTKCRASSQGFSIMISQLPDPVHMLTSLLMFIFHDRHRPKDKIHLRTLISV